MSKASGNIIGEYKEYIWKKRKKRLHRLNEPEPAVDCKGC